MLTPTNLTTNPSQECPPADHAPFEQLLQQFFLPQGETHGFEGISQLWPPLPGKAIMLSFSTSPQTLSLRFDSGLVHREAALSASS